jgi:DNA-binding PadR family transcriptional regulator
MGYNVGQIDEGELSYTGWKAMDLTTRQRVFLVQLLDLYREHQSPVHYTEVADRVGVTKFSAYDMLKVLERKGVVASEYVLDREERGPGRSLIKFYPTALARQWLARRWSGLTQGEEWHQVKEGLLRRLRQAREVSPLELAGELLGQLSESQPPMIYCAQMITILLLYVGGLRGLASGINPLRVLARITAAGGTSLGALAGFSLGSLLSRAGDATESLLTSVSRYQRYLRDLSEENRLTLVSFLQEALTLSLQLAWQPVGDNRPPDPR